MKILFWSMFLASTLLASACSTVVPQDGQVLPHRGSSFQYSSYNDVFSEFQFLVAEMSGTTVVAWHTSGGCETGEWGPEGELHPSPDGWNITDHTGTTYYACEDFIVIPNNRWQLTGGTYMATVRSRVRAMDDSFGWTDVAYYTTDPATRRPTAECILDVFYDKSGANVPLDCAGGRGTFHIYAESP